MVRGVGTNRSEGSGGGMFRGRHGDGDGQGSRVWLCVRARQCGRGSSMRCDKAQVGWGTG